MNHCKEYWEYVGHFLTSPDHRWKLKAVVADSEVQGIAKDMLEWETRLASHLGLTQTNINDIHIGTHLSQPELMRC